MTSQGNKITFLVTILTDKVLIDFTKYSLLVPYEVRIISNTYFKKLLLPSSHMVQIHYSKSWFLLYKRNIYSGSQSVITEELGV